MVAVQSEGCAPIVKAFDEDLEVAEPWPNAETFAAGIRVPKAIGDFLILDAVRASQGCAVAVSEEAIRAAIGEVGAQEGVFMCPEGAACWAAFRVLATLPPSRWVSTLLPVAPFHSTVILLRFLLLESTTVISGGGVPQSPHSAVVTSPEANTALASIQATGPCRARKSSASQ